MIINPVTLNSLHFSIFFTEHERLHRVQCYFFYASKYLRKFEKIYEISVNIVVKEFVLILLIVY